MVGGIPPTLKIKNPVVGGRFPERNLNKIPNKLRLYIVIEIFINMKLLTTLQRLKNTETYKYILNDHHQDLFGVFVNDYNFSVHSHPIRLEIPFNKENQNYFTIKGLQNFLKEISEDYPMDVKNELINTEGILLIYPIIKSEIPLLGIVFLIHEVSDNVFEEVVNSIEQITKTRLDVSVQTDSDVISFIKSKYSSSDEVIGYEDYYDFVEKCKKINTSTNRKDLGFLLIGGIFPLVFNGEKWYSTELKNKKITIP